MLVSSDALGHAEDGESYDDHLDWQQDETEQAIDWCRDHDIDFVE